MRIRVLSDLHLEFKDWNPPKADADVVVLAGDIHVGVKGIEWARHPELMQQLKERRERMTQSAAVRPH